MNRILDEIAAEWKTVKFLRLNVSKSTILNIIYISFHKF